MNARNMAELRNMLMHEAQKAMTVASEKILAEMYHQTGDFYTGGEPKMYERTGTLANTPKTTALSTQGTSVSFDAYLDQSGSYTSGKHPSVGDVLELTNSGSFPGLRPAVGKTGYWDRAETNMEKILNDVLRKVFR